MPLVIRTRLHFDKYVALHGIVPTEDDDALEFMLASERWRAKLFVSDPKQILLPPDTPNNLSEIKKLQNVYVHQLTLQLDLPNPDPGLLETLQHDRIDARSELLGRELFDLIVGVHNRLISYCRNISRQFGLQFIQPDPRNFQNFLQTSGTFWRDQEGQWRLLRFVAENIVHMTTRLLRNGTDRKAWHGELKNFLEGGSKPPMRSVLMANSFEHLYAGNGRLAIVEAVMALEAALKELLPAAIRRLPGYPTVSEDELDDLVERAGLRWVAAVVLRAISIPAELESQDVDQVCRAIEARNTIIHQAQRAIAPERANECVVAVDKVVNRLSSIAVQPRA